VTDLVLAKLLPHANTGPNRARGAWIHVAPTITKDIRSWFENAGWKVPSEWPGVAALVLEFVERTSEGPHRLEEACSRFDASPYSKGLQSAFMSPILNALRPGDYRVVNYTVQRTLRGLGAETTRARVRYYPQSNALVVALHDDVMAAWPAPPVDGLEPGDLADCFAWWFVALRTSRRSRRE